MWSTLEYGCHVRDVHRIFNHRVQLMLGGDEPQFPNWDQDETAIADDYASQNPSTVATELFRRMEELTHRILVDYMDFRRRKWPNTATPTCW